MYDGGNNNLGKCKVFGPNDQLKIDKKFCMVEKMLSRQSDRTLPIPHFHSTYTMVTKNGHGMGGLLLTFWIEMISELKFDFDERLNTKFAHSYVHVIELILMLEEFSQTE